jgi:hypothetical protein
VRKQSKILIIILNLLVLCYSILYLIDLLNSKLIEGYELSLSAIVFDLVCLPFMLYYYFTKQIFARRIIIKMMIFYTICSFVGIKIAIVSTFITSIIFLILMFNKKSDPNAPQSLPTLRNNINKKS